MSMLDQFDFVKKVPKVASAGGKSPLDRAREKLLAEIDAQIKLAADPNYEVVKQTKKRGGGTVETRRKPKSWVSVQDDEAFITVRYSNKPMPLGGKRGSVIRCEVGAVAGVLATVKEWAASDEATTVLDKMLTKSRRKKKSGSAIDGDRVGNG